MAGVTRVRAEDHPDAEVVAELPRGTEVEIHSKGEPFLQISAWHPELGRVSGWVHKSFVQFPEAKKEALDQRQVTDPPCSGCGAHDWVHTPTVRLIQLTVWDAVAVRNRICMSCGLVQECVGPKEAEEVLEWDQKRQVKSRGEGSK